MAWPFKDKTRVKAEKANKRKAFNVIYIKYFWPLTPNAALPCKVKSTPKNKNINKQKIKFEKI